MCLFIYLCRYIRNSVSCTDNACRRRLQRCRGRRRHRRHPAWIAVRRTTRVRSPTERQDGGDARRRSGRTTGRRTTQHTGLAGPRRVSRMRNQQSEEDTMTTPGPQRREVKIGVDNRMIPLRRSEAVIIYSVHDAYLGALSHALSLLR